MKMVCTGKCNASQIHCPHRGVHTRQGNCTGGGQCNGKVTNCVEATPVITDPMKLAIYEAVRMLGRNNGK